MWWWAEELHGAGSGSIIPPPMIHVDPDLPWYTLLCKKERRKATSEIFAPLPPNKALRINGKREWISQEKKTLILSIIWIGWNAATAAANEVNLNEATVWTYFFIIILFYFYRRENIWCLAVRPIESPINLCKVAYLLVVLCATISSVLTTGIENSLLNEPLQKSSCHEELIRSAIKWFIKDLDFSHWLHLYNRLRCSASSKGLQITIIIL